MIADRRQLLRILSASGAVAAGGMVGGGVLKQALATQCEKPINSGCGGGGGGGIGGRGTQITPWQDWYYTYGANAMATFNINHVRYTLAPIWQNYISFGELGAADVANWNAAVMAHASFHIGSDSNYHYGAAATATMAPNCPPQTAVVNIAKPSLSQIQGMQSYLQTTYGIDLSSVPNAYSAGSPIFVDASFGTSSPSAGVVDVLANQQGGNEKSGGNNGGPNPAACGAISRFQDDLTVLMGLAFAVGVLFPPAQVVTDPAIAAWGVDYAIAWAVKKYEQC